MDQIETYVDSAGVTRVRHKEIVLPIRVGTVSWHMGKKASDFATHRWTVYLRHADNEDCSHIIKQVTFQLHASFANSKRDVFSPPYEVSETGWGEFTIQTQVFFVDEAKCAPVEITHGLKLYGDDPNNPKKAVASETHEEIVIVEPSEALWQRVQAVVEQGGAPKVPATEVLEYVQPAGADEELADIMRARQKVALWMARMQA
ncbi:unnamed protein product [Pedinophyceae sp. YPF-701]|nr:unnamed protein product [Pedinophyceae sp. YPF-701]